MSARSDRAAHRAELRDMRAWDRFDARHAQLYDEVTCERPPYGDHYFGGWRRRRLPTADQQAGRMR